MQKKYNGSEGFHFLSVVLLFLVSIGGSTLAGEIETVAGTGTPEANRAGGPALQVNIGEPFGVEFGPEGALYIAEVRNHRVWRLDPKTEELSIVAGTGKRGYSGDGEAATKAELNEPYELRFDREGNLFVVEMKNHIVRKISADTRTIQTVAGTGKEGFSGDGGPATEATLRQPHSIALDAEGNLYIADIGNHRIRCVAAKTGIIETIAGNGTQKLPVKEGPARNEPVLGPRSLAMQEGTLWVCLREGNSVWKLDLEKDRWQHVAGTGKQGYSGDGEAASEATFAGPKGIALDTLAVYIADTENNAIRRIDLTSGVMTTLAGVGSKAREGKDTKRENLARPHGVCVGPEGAVYIGDTNHHRVLRVKP